MRHCVWGVIALALRSVIAYNPPWLPKSSRRLAYRRQSTLRKMHEYVSSSSDTGALSQAAQWKEQAELIRLEADRLDQSLARHKIATIERRLSNKGWVEKHPEQQRELARQLELLQRKIWNGDHSNSAVADAISPPRVRDKKNGQADRTMDTGGSSIPLSGQFRPSSSRPFRGFDEDDLALYLPVAYEIERTMPNGTAAQKLEAFRTADSLQQHFQAELTEALITPMEDVQRLEELRSQYLYSTSSKEKEQLKAAIKRIEESLERSGLFACSDSTYDALQPLTENDIQQRLQAISELPLVLQSVFKSRTNVGPEGDLRLAIQLDYYDHQLHLLERIPQVSPLDDRQRQEIIFSLQSLPECVLDHVAGTVGLTKPFTLDDLVQALAYDQKDEEIIVGPGTLNLASIRRNGIEISVDGPEYEDIEYVDRSRYVEEFYPSIARMEGLHPAAELVDQFVSETLDKSTFMVTCRPERVCGGYYVRGRNLIANDDSGLELTRRLEDRVSSSPLVDRINFFYIPDPAPLTDEAIESGSHDEPVLLITGINQTVFYNYAHPLAKSAVSSLGLFSVLMFSVSCFNPKLDFQQSLLTVASESSWLTSGTLHIAGTVLFIQLIHELGHRIVGWRDKFEIGTPSLFVPSIQIGSLCSITPLRSPPPTLKSMFDFALAGPLAGIIASLSFLVLGLSITVSMDAVQATELQLPCIPVYLLRSSTLGGGLIEFFLGRILSYTSMENSVLALHPFAVAGFIGLVSNALALLPLGNTDGGRIALCMFGRRGSYIVTSLTLMLLCIAGVFALDNCRILLSYTLFAAIWQRELEASARNEVEELNFERGALGIATALVVALTLIPLA